VKFFQPQLILVYNQI